MYVIGLTVFTILVTVFFQALFATNLATRFRVFNLKFSYAFLAFAIAATAMFVVNFILHEFFDIQNYFDEVFITLTIAHMLEHMTKESVWRLHGLVAVAFLAGLVVVILLGLIIRTFFFTPFVVSGDSMQPTYTAGDYLLASRVAFDFERSDIIVYTNSEGTYFIHRVIGVPGDTIHAEGGFLYVNDAPLAEYEGVDDIDEFTLDEGRYFVIGDNYTKHPITQFIEPVPRQRIVGKIILGPLDT